MHLDIYQLIWLKDTLNLFHKTTFKGEISAWVILLNVELIWLLKVTLNLFHKTTFKGEISAWVILLNVEYL